MGTFIHGMNSLLNLIQHHDGNRIQFCQMDGWSLICKCCQHPCSQIRHLSLCFIASTCVASKLCTKYFLQTKWNGIESFELLLNLMTKICKKLNEEMEQNMDVKSIDDLLCKVLCCLNSVCADNMIGYEKFCSHKAWKNIGKLLETIIAFGHPLSDTLYLQNFALLSCFGVPASFESWKRTQYDPMFKNAPKDLTNANISKKLTHKERKLKQKED